MKFQADEPLSAIGDQENLSLSPNFEKVLIVDCSWVSVI